MLTRISRSHANECVEAFGREHDYVLSALRRFGARPADVEDLAHDVFLVLLRNWETFDTGRPLQPYLFGIAFRVFSNYRRRRLREVPHLVAGRGRPPARGRRRLFSRIRRWRSCTRRWSTSRSSAERCSSCTSSTEFRSSTSRMRCPSRALAPTRGCARDTKSSRRRCAGCSCRLADSSGLLLPPRSTDGRCPNSHFTLSVAQPCPGIWNCSFLPPIATVIVFAAFA